MHTRADAAAPGAGRLAVSAWQRALRRQEHFRGGLECPADTVAAWTAVAGPFAVPFDTHGRRHVRCRHARPGARSPRGVRKQVRCFWRPRCSARTHPRRRAWCVPLQLAVPPCLSTGLRWAGDLVPPVKRASRLRRPVGRVYRPAAPGCTAALMSRRLPATAACPAVGSSQRFGAPARADQAVCPIPLPTARSAVQVRAANINTEELLIKAQRVRAPPRPWLPCLRLQAAA